MVKFLRRSVLILLSVAFFYTGLLWLAVDLRLNHWLPNFYSTTGGYGQLLLRMRELKSVDQVDILFMGSSHAYRSFDPRLFKQRGISSFNLGSTAQTPFNTYFLLKEHLPALQPKVVVLELYWNMLVQDGVESTIDILSNTELERGVIEMAAHSRDGQALNSILTNTIRRLHTPLHRLEQEPTKTDLYIPGGYTQSQRSENMLSEQELRELEPMVVKISKLQQDYLQKVIRLCNDQEIKLVFVVSPVTKEFRSKVQNYSAYTAFLSKIAAQHNITFIDYNLRSGLDLHSRYDFYDMDHLTHQGVEKFNRVFLEDIEKRGVLEHNSSNTRFASSPYYTSDKKKAQIAD